MGCDIKIVLDKFKGNTDIQALVKRLDGKSEFFAEFMLDALKKDKSMMVKLMNAGFSRNYHGKGTLLHSGGALGFDSVFDIYADKANHYAGRLEDQPPLANIVITEAEYKEGLSLYGKTAVNLGKNVTSSLYVEALMVRNVQQVVNSDTVYAVASIEGTNVGGGTGYAVDMAKTLDKKIYVYDIVSSSWNTWKDGSWVKVNKVPTPTGNYAGIGTRGDKLTDTQKDNLLEVMNKLYGKKASKEKFYAAFNMSVKVGNSSSQVSKVYKKGMVKGMRYLKDDADYNKLNAGNPFAVSTVKSKGFGSTRLITKSNIDVSDLFEEFITGDFANPMAMAKWLRSRVEPLIVAIDDISKAGKKYTHNEPYSSRDIAEMWAKYNYIQREVLPAVYDGATIHYVGTSANDLSKAHIARLVKVAFGETIDMSTPVIKKEPVVVEDPTTKLQKLAASFNMNDVPDVNLGRGDRDDIIAEKWRADSSEFNAIIDLMTAEQLREWHNLSVSIPGVDLFEDIGSLLEVARKPISTKKEPVTESADVFGTPNNMLSFNSSSGKTSFMSNFQVLVNPIVDDNGNEYYTAEAAYQASKFTEAEAKIMFTGKSITGAKAKQLGSTREYSLVEGFNDNRVDIMKEIQTAKYSNNTELMAKLIATGSTHLVEDTTKWKDTFWGYVIDTGKGTVTGRNNMGDILADVRDTSLDSKTPEVPNQKGVAGNIDKELDTKLTNILKKLYPEIKLSYTTQQILHGEGVMNQEIVDNTVKFGMKVVSALYEIGTAKPSKHGGASQPVLSTVRVKQEASIRKRLSSKGVSKEQIDFVFKFMKQNAISEISTLRLAERVLSGLATPVEVKAIKNAEFYKYLSAHKEYEKDPDWEYVEMEIATPNIVVPEKGHAEFATDRGMGWYRIWKNKKTGVIEVQEMQSDMFQKMRTKVLTLEEVEYKKFGHNIKKEINRLTDLKTLMGNKIADLLNEGVDSQRVTKELAMYPKEDILRYGIDRKYIYNTLLDSDSTKDIDKRLAEYEGYLKEAIENGGSMEFLQILNTDSKWVKFFIQSIIQNAEKNGYKKIRFPSGKTVVKIENHESSLARMDSIDKELIEINKYDKQGRKVVFIVSNLNDDFDIGDIFDTKEKAEEFAKKVHGRTVRKSKQEIDLSKKSSLLKERASIKSSTVSVHEFYQVRVKNTLIKTYGKKNVKEITDEQGNGWFELTLDNTRDSDTIMLQRTTNVKTVFTNPTKATEGIRYDISTPDGAQVGYVIIEDSTTLEAVMEASDIEVEDSTFTEKELSTEVVVLNSLFIDEEYRGQEYGVSAMNTLINKYDDNSLVLLDAYPTDDNIGQTDLVEFYKSLGFNILTKTGQDFVDLMVLDRNQVKRLQQVDGEIKGQANIEAKTVLINSLLQSQDTLPHEYAHHYIAMFRETPIVKEAIRKWGSEEKLVQAIGEQVVTQKGEVYSWWKEFSKWVKSKFDGFSKMEKEEIKNVLTDAFLMRENLDAIANKGSIKLAEGSNSLLVPVENVETSVAEELEGFTAKDEVHLTVLGFPQGKELKAIFSKNPAMEGKVQRLIDNADFSYTEGNDVYKISRDREAFVDWKDKSKGKEVLHEEAVIRLVEAPGIETFIGEINKLLNTDFPVPFPHISLGVKGTKFGIGIANEAAFNGLNPEKVDTKGGANVDVQREAMKTKVESTIDMSGIEKLTRCKI